MKTMETTEELSSDGMEKRVERHNWRQIAPCAREKPRDANKKVLANLWSRQRIKKNHEKGLRRSWARSHMGNVSLLDVGGAYPNEDFSVVEFHGDSDYHELVKVEGETISVTGMIKDYRGKPEIIISSPTDISD